MPADVVEPLSVELTSVVPDAFIRVGFELTFILNAARLVPPPRHSSKEPRQRLI